MLNFFTKFGGAMAAASRAFREQYVTSGQPDALEQYDTVEGRLLRYEMLWASYENTAYRNIHTWAPVLKNKYGLYKYIRNIYNPTFRLGEFYRMMVWGGLLDTEARQKGAIPIEVYGKADEANLRNAISVVWDWSNWGVKKSTVPLWGSVLGEAFIKVCDDNEKGQVYFELVHPSTVWDIELDARGYIKSYEIREQRVHPDTKKPAIYSEIATRDGVDVVYSTFADGKAFKWDNDSDTWRYPYGFIPMVMVQQNNVGGKWGFAETHNDRSKIMELDDMSSKLHDHIRKMTDPAWLANFPKPQTTPQMTTGSPTADRPEPGREELPIVYVNQENARLQPMVVPELDIQKVGMEIDRGLAELERDYPELQMDIWSVGADTSGRALRAARQRVEKKVMERRAGYDFAIVAAQKMAVTIGGMRGYEGFSGFNADSYKEGKLSHRVGQRDIFDTDHMEQVQEKLTFWQAVQAGTLSGVAPEVVLKDMGWDDKKIQEEFYANPQEQ